MDATEVTNDTPTPAMTRRAWCGRCGVYTYDGEKIPCSEKSGYTWEACELSKRMPEVVPIEERQKHEEAKAAAQQEKARKAKMDAEMLQKSNPGANSNTIPLSALGVQELLQRPDPTEETTTWDGLQSLEGTDKQKAIDLQVGGDHYKFMSIQPIEYVMANGIPFPEGNIIKYVTRWRSKGGIGDLEKARHMLDVLIEYERDREVK